MRREAKASSDDSVELLGSELTRVTDELMTAQRNAIAAQARAKEETDSLMREHARATEQQADALAVQQAQVQRWCQGVAVVVCLGHGW